MESSVAGVKSKAASQLGHGRGAYPLGMSRVPQRVAELIDDFFGAALGGRCLEPTLFPRADASHFLINTVALARCTKIGEESQAVSTALWTDARNC